MTAVNAYDELEQRGFIYQCTDPEALRPLLGSGKVTFYVGFDPTAASLHVGSLVPILGMVHMQKAGHRPIALLGGGTAMVGDPSGKRELRRIISREEIEKNGEGIKAQLGRFLDFTGGGTLLLDNARWLLELNYVAFIRDIGRYLSVNKMLARESARLRYESEAGLSFLEFNYACLQAYDFFVLSRDFGCVLQLGGQDQWGNICEGIDLIARPDISGRKVYGMTFPLLIGPGGEKFGKTAGGTIWLDPALTSPFDYYQFWRNTDDGDVGRYLLLFTLLPVEEARRLGALQPPAINRAKEILAFECTAMVHGFETARQIYAGAAAQFGRSDPGGKIPTTSRILEAAPAEGAEGTVPTHEVTADDLHGGLAVLDLLVRSGLCKSKGEGRRSIQQGGVYINDERVASADAKAGAEHFKNGSMLLRIGKKSIRKIVLK